MKRSINLLPEKFVQLNSMKRLAFIWFWIVLAVVVLIGFKLRHQSLRLTASEDMLRVIERKVTPLNYMLAESESIDHELQALADQKLSPNRQNKSLTAILANVLMQLQLSKQKLSVEKMFLVRSVNNDFTLKIAGVGTTSTVVHQLVERLKEKRMFQTVLIESNQDLDASGITVKKYIVACQF